MLSADKNKKNVVKRSKLRSNKFNPGMKTNTNCLKPRNCVKFRSLETLCNSPETEEAVKLMYMYVCVILFEIRSAYTLTKFKHKFGWTKNNLLEQDLNLRPPDWRAGALPTELSSPTLAVSLFCQYLCSGAPVRSHETIYCPLARFITWYLYNKVVSLYGASLYCLFPGCIVTWAWSLAKGQYMVSLLILTGAPEQRYLF